MDPHIEEHIKQVGEWLDKNVQKFAEPKTVTLFDFEVDWEEFSGSFRLSLDNVVLKERIRFGLEASGKVIFYRPMFHSPLGAPCSYSAIDITPKTEVAITKALREAIPRVKGAGIDRDTGREVNYHTPPALRISQEKLAEARKKVTKSYVISLDLSDI